MYERANEINNIYFQVFFWLPFLFEIKIILDRTFTKTSLRIWDWFTFETIYAEFYGAKVSVEKDKNHNMGDPRGWISKIIFGY